MPDSRAPTTGTTRAPAALALGWRAHAPTFVLAGAALVTIALLASRVRYVPVWDGRIYAECFLRAARPPFSMDEFRCATHPSQAYAAFMALVQLVAPTSYVPMLVANAVLLVVASAGMARIVRLVFPSSEHDLDRALIVTVFSLQPSILASVVQPGLDFPLVPGFVWALVAVLERRWILLSSIGVVMAFTKETGVLLYVVLVASFALSLQLERGLRIRDRVVRVLRVAPLGLPVVAFVAYVAYRAADAGPGESAIWSAGSPGGSIVKQFLIPRLDLYLINYLVILFVLNFAWIASGWIAFDAFVGTVRKAHRLPRRAVPGTARDQLFLVGLVAVATVYALTRFATFGNTRYLVPVFPVLLVPFYAALVRLAMPTPVRRLVLGAFAAALLVSNVRTIDPFSRSLYGTFAAGTRSLLRMTAITGECCGAGRDQLAYNLEFTTLAELTSDATALHDVADTTLVVVPDLTDWDTIGLLDSTTSRRTLDAARAVRPLVIEHDSLLKSLDAPARAVFLGLPYGDVPAALEELRAVYDVGPERRVQRNGYWLSTYALRARTQRP